MTFNLLSLKNVNTKMEEETIIKKYEDILRRYNILNKISKIVASNNDLNKILKTTLKGITFGDGFGFNRAFLFLLDKKENYLVGKLAIGTETAEEAWKTWQEIQEKNYSLEEFLSIEKLGGEDNSALNKKLVNLKIPIIPGKIIDQCFKSKNPKIVDLTLPETSSDNGIVNDPSMIENEILELLNHPKFCIVPLICRTKRVGMLIVDNKYNNREITQDDATFLLMLGQFVASSIRNTIIYSELKESFNKLAKVNAQIKILKEYNENIIESIPLNVFVIDNYFNITSCNKNFSDLMNLTKEEIIGKNINDFSIKVGDFALTDCIKEVMDDKKIGAFYKTKISINNKCEDSFYDLSLVTLKDSKGNIIGVIGLIDDITKIVNLEKALQETRKFSELGKLAATVAHEIRNPLIAIGGYANRIKRKYLENKEFDIENIEIIIKEINRLEKILNDIMDFTSNRRIEFCEISLNKVILDCLELAQIPAEQNNVIINSLGLDKILENHNLIILGSYDDLKAAFINLLNNAIEASKPKQVIDMNINIIENNDQKWAEVQITNQATIQNEENLSNIFLPFYTTKIHGAGLGLAVTKKIIEGHHGNINVESNNEIGTTFTVKLPLIKIENNV
jgi:PAS domain S-box-containing protein